MESARRKRRWSRCAQHLDSTRPRMTARV
uniref:Uncharacterized protein n=1 Tax=Arundo donax TaxID=35708 RepID=A0A0A8Z928_ARUDO